MKLSHPLSLNGPTVTSNSPAAAVRRPGRRYPDDCSQDVLPDDILPNGVKVEVNRVGRVWTGSIGQLTLLCHMTRSGPEPDRQQAPERVSSLSPWQLQRDFLS